MAMAKRGIVSVDSWEQEEESSSEAAEERSKQAAEALRLIYDGLMCS